MCAVPITVRVDITTKSSEKEEKRKIKADELLQNGPFGGDTIPKSPELDTEHGVEENRFFSGRKLSERKRNTSGRVEAEKSCQSELLPRICDDE